MFVKTFAVGLFQCNCTILGDKNTGDAIVIDPGDEADRIIKELENQSFKVKYILHTHAHLDHIGGTKNLKEAAGGIIALHKDDLFLYENIKMQGEALGMQPDPEVRPVDQFLADGDSVEWGAQHRANVLHTPGHTPGSLSFLVQMDKESGPLLFAGDTLFFGSIGRTDLWGGDYGQIIASIKTKLLTLDNNTTVVTGHGPSTTIGNEKQSNPFLQ